MQGIPGTEMIGPGTVGHRDSGGNRNQRDVQALNLSQKMPVGNRRSTGFPYYVYTLVIGFGAVMGFNKVLLDTFAQLGQCFPPCRLEGFLTKEFYHLVVPRHGLVIVVLRFRAQSEYFFQDQADESIPRTRIRRYPCDHRASISANSRGAVE